MITEEEYLKMKQYVTDYENQKHIDTEEQPYLEEVYVEVIKKYNPQYGNSRICKCGHKYHRHFDSYDYMEAIGCKYCDCNNFIEEKK